MWISEGFLHGTSEDLEELGSKYHKELILRNLIESNPKYIDQSVCNMHDVVHTFAQFIARYAALAAHSDESNIVSKLSAQKFLRLSLESKSSESDGLDWSSLRAQRTLRTLILVGDINIKPGDSLSHFPCLRTLHISSAHVGVVERLHELKHLRYLSLEQLDISSLPESIGNMIFLQYISLAGCQKLVKLPDGIVKLGQLRFIHLINTNINGIPRGFCVLTKLIAVYGFPTSVDGNWCSLQELGPLYRLKVLTLHRLENVSASSFAAKAKLSEKVHLTDLELTCGSRLGDNGLIEDKDIISKEEQQRIEQVFDELCPPPSLDYLAIRGYFGLQLPRWMMSSSAVPLKCLRTLMIEDLACCTQLPDGLCQLPCLEIIQIDRASAIKHVGPEFLQSDHHQSPHPSETVAAFPRLHVMKFFDMVEWEEWEWEEQVHAFPVLQELMIGGCKLRRLPPGLASQAKALNELDIEHAQGLFSVENFASLVELKVSNLDLEMISNLPRLHKLTIKDCPKLKLLQGVPALHRLVLEDDDMETLPAYLAGINPRHLELCCSLALLASIAAGQLGPEWDKFSHVEHIKAYAPEGDNPRKWYVLCTAKPYNLETNVSRSFMSKGTLSFFEDAQRFESVFKMTRKTFNYICSLVFGPSMEDMNMYTFIDGRALCLEDRVAVALRRLYSCESTETLGSSVGVSESTISLVTEAFVVAVRKRAIHHLWCPDSSKMDQIKSMFDKNHNMHNCCGVIYTTHIPFGPNCDHEKNDCFLMQAVIDPKMSFTNIWLEEGSSMNRPTIMHDSELFKVCEKGAWLNGSKLKASSDGSEVGEYIIGDAGYPLLPWLLTPYQEEDLSDAKAEFNKRHYACTSCALKAMARFEDTWKYLQRVTWCLINPQTYYKTIYACCILHNIVIDMENDEAMPSAKEVRQTTIYCQEVRQLENEDAVRVRDLLSLYFLTTKSSESGVAVDAEENHEVVSSALGYEGKEQEVQTITADEEKQC